MKVISFNANGIRAAARKGFYSWLAQEQADFVCIQETKAQRDQLEAIPDYFPAGYHCDYFDAEKKGYSGVAIYARKPPIAIQKGFGCQYCDTEGRYLQFDYPGLTVISLYLPSGSSGPERQAVKFQVLERFAQQMEALKSNGNELIICGDYNIAHRNIDLKNWRGNQKNSGFLPEERAWLDHVFDTIGLVDAFRVLNQEPDQYTWWSMRQRAWEKNVGWRIDYQMITPGLVSALQTVSIYREQPFSDHAPLIMTYDVTV
ncbi:MAG: exodeoxyribonuclease III [Gammaproteobacteria bacterium]|jgi:exodeoxyribonuclease-3|nr:exodeoxyribonuclease III [Gammaproteobacteria bacterium]